MRQTFAFDETLDFKLYFKIVKKFWYVPVVLISASVLIAFWQVKYSIPLYTLKTSIQIKDKSTHAYGAQSFLEGGSLFSSFKNINNELEVIRSYGNIQAALKELNMPYTYSQAGDINEYLYYKDSPIQLTYDSTFIIVNNKISITVINQDEFEMDLSFGRIKPYDPISGNYADTTLKPVHWVKKRFRFNEPIILEMVSFKIVKTDPYSPLVAGTKFYIRGVDLESQTYMVRSKMQLSVPIEGASIIQLNTTGPNKQQESELVNKIAEVYIRRGLTEKNQIATNTVTFIDMQLSQIADSLNLTENRLQKFKSKNQVYDIDQVAKDAYSKMSILDQSKSELQLQNKYYEYLRNYVSTGKPFNEVVAPTTVNISDPLVNKLVSELVGLYEEKNSLLMTSSERSPAYQTVVLRIKSAKEALIENVNNIVISSKIALNDINERIFENERMLNSLPAKERDFINIQRHFSLNDNIYTYLLQKRAEASIAKASNLSDAVIIDVSRIRDAYMVFPKPNNNYAVAIFAGFFLSAIFVVGMSFYDDKVESNEDVERYTNIPILGGIGLLDEETINKTKVQLTQSPLTEAFRSVRVNLQYIVPESKSLIIGITSCISGDGKSFASYNLARIYALSGKKVLLICADLRKKMHNEDFGIDQDAKGLSDYLIGKSEFDSVYHQVPTNNMWVMPSGPLPPNAAELLGSARMKELFTRVRETFDVIVVDSSPAGIVSDYLTIMPYIDVNMFVVRLDYTRKNSLVVLQQIKELGQETGKFYILMNGINRMDSYGYSYGYGYGYGMETRKENVFTRILDKIKTNKKHRQ